MIDTKKAWNKRNKRTKIQQYKLEKENVRFCIKKSDKRRYYRYSQRKMFELLSNTKPSQIAISKAEEVLHTFEIKGEYVGSDFLRKCFQVLLEEGRKKYNFSNYYELALDLIMLTVKEGTVRHTAGMVEEDEKLRILSKADVEELMKVCLAASNIHGMSAKVFIAKIFFQQ